jgi:ParB-like chromosome segregation protein Spo0J
LEAVERFQRTIGWVQTQGLRTEVSLDVMAGGQMVLVDGVHRAAAALALGIPLVKGQVVAIVRQKN